MYPNKNEIRLINEFGVKIAFELQPKVNAVFNELMSLIPDWSKHTLVSGTEWAIGIMRERHPELSQETLKALGWAFSFWWK
jgi:hypothetical protein